MAVKVVENKTRRKDQDELDGGMAGGGKFFALWAWLGKTWRSITLEPNILLYICSLGVLYGSEVQTNLKLWKACRVVLGHNETVCDNLDDEANEDVQNEVQTYVTNFDLYGNFISAIPGVVYSFFAGALSDKYGRKPLLYLPMTGWLVSAVLDCINYAYIRELPMEFFYFDNLYYVLGGNALYYLGIYGYGADVTTDAERATRFARFDGLEMVGFMIGTALSPKLFNWGGNYLNYGVVIVLSVFAIAYIALRVEETKKGEEDDDGKERSSSSKESALSKYLWTPLKEFAATVSRKRPGNIRTYVYLLLIIYAMYWSVLSYNSQLYLYMLKVFPGFDGDKYATYNLYHQILGIIGLLVLLPLFGGRLGWHETSTSLAVNLSLAFGLIAASFVKTLWPGFYLTRFFCGFAICQYSIARSLFTKCVGPEEVGKIFSAVAIIAAVCPMITDPIFKKLYTATLASFPSAFLLFAGGFYVVSSALWIFLWRRRSEMKAVEEDKEGRGGADKKKVRADENDNADPKVGEGGKVNLGISDGE